MKPYTLSVVAAIGKNTRAIGKDNQLLFRISDDLKRFRMLTTGHPIIMGRKTYESIGKPLPNRTNIIVTRNKHYNAPGCIVAHSLDAAIEEAVKLDATIFVIGGAELWKEALPLVDKLYLTLIDDDTEGDAHFPQWQHLFTEEVFREDRADTATGLKYSWVDVIKPAA